MAYTCAKCVRRHTRKNSLLDDFATLCSQHLESPFSASAYSLSALTSPVNSNTIMQRSRSTTFDRANIKNESFEPIPLASPGGITSSQDAFFVADNSEGLSSMGLLASASNETGTSSSSESYQVVVSQYHNQKIFSVCALLSDYLECTGGAILLMEDSHVWILAHKGLPSNTLQSGSFLSLCQQAMKLKSSLTISHRPSSLEMSGPCTGGPRGRKKSNLARNSPPTFQFFGATPISLKSEMSSVMIGCLVVLDILSRDENDSKKIEKTLEKLALVVMNLLIEEKNILRLYSSGDFKIFTSNEQVLTDSLGPTRRLRQQQQQLHQMNPHHHHYEKTRSAPNSPAIASALRPVTMMNTYMTGDNVLSTRGSPKKHTMARSKSYTAGEIARSLFLRQQQQEEEEEQQQEQQEQQNQEQQQKINQHLMPNAIAPILKAA
jgi:hypothetical protein